MASGPKKAILPELSLPPVTVFDDGTFGYLLRYRIVSEDINRFSPYSSIFKVRPNYIFERPIGKNLDSIAVNSGGLYVDARWDPIVIKDRVSGTTVRNALEYDVFVQWGKGETNPSPVWLFAERQQSTAIGLVHPTQYELTDGTILTDKPNRLSVEVYLRSTNPSRNNTSLLVYKLDGSTV